MEFTFIGPEWGDDAEGGGDENGSGHGDDDGGKGKNGAAAANNSGNGEEKKPKSATQLEGEEMVGELVAATEGLMCTMEVIAVMLNDNQIAQSKFALWSMQSVSTRGGGVGA